MAYALSGKPRLNFSEWRTDRDALEKAENSVLLLTEIAVRNAIVFPSAIPASVLGQQQHRYYWERSVSGIVYTQKQFLYRPK